MPDTANTIFFSDTRSEAVFAADGPKPRFLLDAPGLKALVVGLEPGGRIPLHADGAALYHFLEGEGLMTVGDETFAVKPGVTVVVPDGERRGLNARTRVVFLGSKGA